VTLQGASQFKPGAVFEGDDWYRSFALSTSR
jgi:hypothetical protein